MHNQMAQWWMATLMVLCVGHGRAQPSAQAAATATSNPTSLMDTFKKSVVFLFTQCSDIGPTGQVVNSTHAGTAFLLSVADPRLQNMSFTYLVTNRHVAQPGIEDGRSCHVISYSIRADLRAPAANGSYSIIETLPTSGLNWVFSPDAAVDLAISPIGLKTETLDVAFIPSSLLLSKEDVATHRIVEGDSVLFTGLFVQFIGQVHSEPIVREGKIAMMPREKVPTTLRKLGDIYLVDTHVFGGNSGSPMLVDLGGVTLPSERVAHKRTDFGLSSGCG